MGVHSTRNSDFVETTGRLRPIVESASGPECELLNKSHCHLEYGAHKTPELGSPSFVPEHGVRRPPYIAWPCHRQVRIRSPAYRGSDSVQNNGRGSPRRSLRRLRQRVWCRSFGSRRRVRCIGSRNDGRGGLGIVAYMTRESRPESTRMFEAGTHQKSTAVVVESLSKVIGRKDSSTNMSYR